MEATTTTGQKVRDGAPGAGETPTLGALERMSARELGDLYGRGRVPASLGVLDGQPVGRMLAIVGVPKRSVVAEGIRRFARSAAFPWRGKSFRATDAASGTGANRVRVAGTRELFPFATRVEPSAVDGAPCILLDYDRPGNPWVIRQVRDELREVAQGLFLGPAMAKLGSGSRTVLWFAVDATGA